MALVRHIVAFEEANPAVHILAPRQKWKATFLAYFLGAVSQGQLTIMKQLGDEAYAAGLADQNCWQVRTSKRLIYHCSVIARTPTLAGTTMLSLRTSTATCRPFAGHLTKSWDSFLGSHRLDYDDVPSIDWYISLSAVQGHSRVSDVADPSTLGEPLTLDRCRALGYITRNPQQKLKGQSSRLATWDADPVWQVPLLLQCEV